MVTGGGGGGGGLPMGKAEAAMFGICILDRICSGGIDGCEDSDRCEGAG